MHVRIPALAAACLAALGLVVLTGSPNGRADTSASLQSANTVPAQGSFTLITANGIASTLDFNDIVLSGISHGAAYSDSPVTHVSVTLPVIAQNGSANFAAGGFQFTNRANHRFVNCQTPVVDTQAHVLDCVLKDLKTVYMFSVTDPSPQPKSSNRSVTAITKGLEVRVYSQQTADFLNAALGTNAFSPSVLFATADLTVNTAR